MASNANLLILHEHAHLFTSSTETPQINEKTKLAQLPDLRTLTMAYVGDPANVLDDMLVTFPRLGHKILASCLPVYASSVGTSKGVRM